MNVPSLLRCITLLVLTPALALAQGWEKKFGSAINHKGYYAQPTADGGYILGASSQNAVYGFYDDMKIIKTNAAGDTLWTRTFDDVDVSPGRMVQPTRDGGYVVLGTSKSVGGLLHLTKLHPDGSVEWRKAVASPWSTINIALIWGYSIKQTADGGFIIAGELCYVGGGSSDAVLVKTTAQGELIWGRNFRIGWEPTNAATAVEPTPDGGYILTGSMQTGGFIMKTDAWGYEQWEKTLVEFRFSDIKRANKDSGYVLIGSKYAFLTNTRHGAYFLKINNNGDTLYTKFLGGRDTVTLCSIDTTNDGGYCMAGYTREGSPASDVLLIKTNSTGDTLWTRRAGDAQDDFGYSARQTEDGNYIVAGTTTGSNGQTQAYLIRTDKLGNVLTNVIAGSVFEDKNNNCLPDTGERKLANAAYWKIRVTPGDKYVVPDAWGNYSVKVDTGAFEVDLINTHPYWQPTCPTARYAVSFHQFYDTATSRNFGLVTKADCPWMWVDVASSIVRPCRETTHTIRYCNNGTADATHAYLEVTLDPALSFLRSTPAPAAQNDRVLRYDLGTLKEGECGTLNVTTMVACTAVANSSVCVQAKLYPDAPCTPPAPEWDKSSVSVSGRCLGKGIVQFTILNTGKAGEGDMQGPSEYRIYVNNALVQTNTFQLKGGDSLVVQLQACGKTVRLEADQRPGHPGKSRPRATVEGCTGCDATPPSLGVRTAVAADDADAAVEEDCAIVRASFDPNEKLVSPAGITSSHWVSPNDELEYRINFQNTGNDTAFRVVVKDTLDLGVLDIASLVPGVASHPYTFRMSGKGVLEWTFENILLPDSTTNEKASHGFIKFKINQRAGLANGTTISNKAGIYFDFNAPVLTDPATVTVSDLVPIDRGDYKITIVAQSQQDTTTSYCTIAPHPLRTSSVLKIQAPDIGAADELLFTLFDASGRKVRTVFFTNRQAELKRESLPAGLYFWEVRKGARSMATGKLWVQ